MLQKLLAERFKLSVHAENQTMDTYNLIALKPKLKTSEIDTRTKCFEGPGPDGKDPRIKNPILNRLRTCQGISMVQFAQTLQTMDPDYIKTPVLDATGIDGAYDFTLSYTAYGKLFGKAAPSANAASAASAADGASTAPDPNGGLSLFDALTKELGLKLEKVRRPVPVLGIDHVEEKPTEN
jgi:uncharacterized protein (TIGR03435 family)